jgi:hypothetical protein
MASRVATVEALPLLGRREKRPKCETDASRSDQFKRDVHDAGFGCRIEGHASRTPRPDLVESALAAVRRE